MLDVGYSGNATLRITNGGTVRSGAGYVGYSAGGSGTVAVDGAGSTWASSGSLYLGYAGNATLTVTNGSAVASGAGYVGYSTGGSGAVAVDGAGSTWASSGSLYLGNQGNATLKITNGGAVTSYYAVIGYSSYGGSGTVAVDGAGSMWTNAGGGGANAGESLCRLRWQRHADDHQRRHGHR